MRRRIAVALPVAAAAALLAAGCSSSVRGQSSAPPALTVASSRPTESTSAPPGTSPYHLDIPTDDQHELFRWVSGDRGGTVLFDDVRAGHHYRIEGGCVYGYADQLTYRVLDGRAGTITRRTLATGTIDCDGNPHARAFRATSTTPIELLPGRMGEKTVAYLRLLPQRS